MSERHMHTDMHFNHILYPWLTMNQLGQNVTLNNWDSNYQDSIIWAKLITLLTICFSLNVPDLRPNVGLFWYFFTEMFENFRLLFIYAFQINAALLYLVPLTLRLHGEPMLLAASLTALMAVFKSYPSLGDVGFYLALLPMWKHLFNCEFRYICSIYVTWNY
jgi:GPI transamidase subunit PIG-U.